MTTNKARRSALLTVVIGALTLAACASHTDGAGSLHKSTSGAASPSTSSSTSSSSSAPAPAPAAQLALTPTRTSGVDPAVPITAKVTDGKIDTVALTNTATKLVVKGAVSADGTTWTAGEDLGYSKHYRLTAVAENADGVKVTRTTQFSTLTPDNQTAASIDTIYGNAIVDGGTYGIGMIPVVTFDEHITNEAAAERALQVTTSPHVDGVWDWLDDQHVHWRPQGFYTPGTKVTINAKIYGVQVGDGLYGQSDETTSFVIGAKHVSIADDNTHQVKVYFDGKLVKKMDTSMGKHEGEYVNGTYISFFTMDGTYTVIGHENPAIMSSASYGLPLGAPGSYPPEKVYWSTKISTDGIYLHELDSTVDAQGHYDTSHGCLNLNHDNAQWFFEHSRVGDVVIIKHNGGPKIDLQQGGDWSVPWKTWVAGSALS